MCDMISRSAALRGGAIEINGCNSPTKELAEHNLETSSRHTVTTPDDHDSDAFLNIPRPHDSQVLVPLALHKHGCCVIQRTIDRTRHPAQVQALFGIILDSAIVLMSDQFGNYVVQYALTCHHHVGGDRPDQVAELLTMRRSFFASLIRIVRGSMVSLCCQKFSSNVVEQMLAHAPAEERSLLFMDLSQPPTMDAILKVGGKMSCGITFQLFRKMIPCPHFFLFIARFEVWSCQYVVC